MLRACTVPTPLGTVSWFWYIRAVHCEWLSYISAVHCELILVYQCCPPRVDSGISMLSTWVTWWWRLTRVTSQDCSMEISAHISQSFLSIRQSPISQHPRLWVLVFGSHRIPTSKTTSTLHETVPTIPPTRHKPWTLATFVNMTTIKIDFYFWLLSTSHWTGLTHCNMAPIIELFCPSYSWPTTNLLTTSRPHQCIKCNVSLTFCLSSCRWDGCLNTNSSWQDSWVW